MNYLIDTHCFLWSLFSPGKLNQRVADVLKDGSNTIHVSAVSFWEISIKHAIGKLTLKGVTPSQLPGSARAANYELLPLSSEEAASFHGLPIEKHRDPFDRMLAWQAIERSMILLSRDGSLAQYCEQGLRVEW